MRRLAVTVVVAAVLAALTGCASIPQSGPVEAVNVNPGDDGLVVDILPRDPPKDAGPQEILEGFINAAASPQNNYEIARRFLTPDFSSDWNPDAGTIVDRGVDRAYTATADDAMSLTLTPSAQISAHGQYSETPDAGPVDLAYTFAKVKGQWRISAAPDGIVIDQPTFPLVFGSYDLYFFDPTFTYLVPDLRYFARRPSTPTAIVRELLNGPSAWLQGAVATAFPDGAALVADLVTVSARVAQVPLNSAIVRADQQAQERMQVQLNQSLESVSNISDVSILSNGVEMDIPDLPVQDQPKTDSRPLVLRGGVFGYLPAGGDDLEPVAGISDRVAALAPAAVTLGLDARAAVALTDDGAVYVPAGGEPQLVDDRGGLIAPTIDARGFIWSVPRSRPGAVQAFAADGTPYDVVTTWGDATSITALSVSRDGTRIVALLGTPSGARFVAVGIVRDPASGAPVRLGDPVDLAIPAGEPRDAAWVDDNTVVALGSGGATDLVTQPIGGASAVIEGADGAVVVAGGNTVRDLRLLTVDGLLEQRRGIVWQTRLDGVAVLATQQGH